MKCVSIISTSINCPFGKVERLVCTGSKFVLLQGRENGIVVHAIKGAFNLTKYHVAKSELHFLLFNQALRVDNVVHGATNRSKARHYVRV